MARTALAALALALTAGCGIPASTPGARLTFLPDPPAARRGETLCASIAGSAPPTAARVWMPGMPHPVTTTPLAPDGQGASCGQVIFVMGGRWAVTLQGGDGSATVTVEVTE